MLGAVMFGHRAFQPVIDAIISLAERSAKEPRDFQCNEQASLYARIRQSVAEDLGRAYSITARRSAATRSMRPSHGSRRAVPPGAQDAPSARLSASWSKRSKARSSAGRILAKVAASTAAT
jgi:polyribonucleotide nucleotidyltransferase